MATQPNNQKTKGYKIMPTNNIHETMYQKLIRLLPDLDNICEYAKLEAPGFLDLNVDILNRTETYTDVAISHYYKHHSNDMIADPDVEIRVWRRGAVEVLTYQDCFGYRVVYHKDDGSILIDHRAKKELNSFLNTWLSNLLAQGRTRVTEVQP